MLSKETLSSRINKLMARYGNHGYRENGGGGWDMRGEKILGRGTKSVWQ